MTQVVRLGRFVNVLVVLAWLLLQCISLQAAELNQPELITTIKHPVTGEELAIRHEGAKMLAHDIYLISTTKGEFFWNALTRKTIAVDGIVPSNEKIKNGFPLAQGMLLHLASKQEGDRLVWWDATEQPVSGALTIINPVSEHPGYEVYIEGRNPGRIRLVHVSDHQVLVCGTGDLKKKQADVIDIRVQAGQATLQWDETPTLRDDLLKVGVVGPVWSVAKAIKPEESTLPVMFDIATCEWYVKSLPAIYNEKSDSDHVLQNHDGPLVTGKPALAQVRFLPGNDFLAAVEKVNPPGSLNPLLHWQAIYQQWVPLAEPAYVDQGNLNDLEIAMTVEGPIVAKNFPPDFVELLDVHTMQWVRSAQSVPEDMSYLNLEGLSDGSVMASEGFRAGLLHFNPVQDGVSPVLLYPHAPKLTLKNGDEFYPGLRTEIKRAGQSGFERLASMPMTAKSFKVMELADGSVLASGFEQPRCNVYTPVEACAWPLRYQLGKGQWQRIDNLKVPMQEGVTTKDGALLFLRPDTDELNRWSPQQGVVTLAPFLQPRQQGTLLLLNDGRVALLGGETQSLLLAKEKSCSDCPEERISIGEKSISLTTEVFESGTNTWHEGPLVPFPVNAAAILENGKVFIITQSYDKNRNSAAAVSDPEFHSWHRLPDAPIGYHRVISLRVTGNKVRVLGVPVGDGVCNTATWDDDLQQWSTY